MNIFTKYKKVFLIAGFITVTILLGFLLYKTFFQGETGLITEIPGTTTTTPGGLPAAEEGVGQVSTTTGTGMIPGSEDVGTSTGVTAPVGSAQPNPNVPSNIALGGLTAVETLSSSPVLSSTAGATGGVQYYNQEDGYFYKIGNNGQTVKMSDRVFHDVTGVVWAPSKNKAILEYPDGSKILYDFSSQKQINYPSHWENFSFSPQSDQLVAKSIALDPDNRFLTISSDDGSNVINLEEIGTNADKVQASWSPNNQIVATYTKGLDLNRQEVFFVGLNGENFKSTIVEGRGLNYIWSTTGDRLLYSVYNTTSDMKPLLWIVDAQGDSINENRQSLGINTWADKCTFASNTEVYCAVPTNLESGSGIIRSIADDNSDELYKIDLTTGTKSLIAIPNGSFNAENLAVDNSKTQLTFSDKNTGLLYKINLK